MSNDHSGQPAAIDSRTNARPRTACGHWLWRWVRRFFRQPHAWKETRRETLGRFTHFGSCPQEMTTMYRVGVFETCLLTGESRIRQINSLHPQDSSPNIGGDPRAQRK